MQKAFLPSPLTAVLQLRLPTRTLLVFVDARAGLALESPERPAPPAVALPAQATLRHALTGARLESVALETPADDPRRAPHLALAFSTPRGPRTLIAEPQPRPLLLLLGEADRIVWTSADKDAGPLPVERRPGATHPRGAALPLPASDEPGPDATALIEAEDQRSFAARKAALLAKLKARVHKLERTLAAVQADRQKAERADADRHKAELLLPHQGRIERGAREALVPDWSRLDDEGQPAQVKVALDPALSAAENATRWLRKAQRLKAAVPRIDARTAEVQAELAAALAARTLAESAQGRAALTTAEESVSLPRARVDQTARGQGRKPERVPYRAFRSASGARILVGRSASDNDALTLQARGNDLWLHAQGLPGSHVVVPDPGDAPDSRTLADAALLAAHFSTARGQSGVEVAWTRRKHVRKTKGAAPGSVTISQEKAVRVRLDEARLAALLAAEE